MSADIFEVDGKRYTSQKASQLYVGSGTAMDWFYSEDANRGSPYRAASFTIELRDTGLYGFQLPPSEVVVQKSQLYTLSSCFLIVADHTQWKGVG